MLSNQNLLIVLGIGAGIILLALRSIVLRRRRARTAEAGTSADTGSDQTAIKRPTAATAASSPAQPTIATSIKTETANPSPTGAGPVRTSVAEFTAAERLEQPLFNARRHLGNDDLPLPRIEPHQVPGADTSDLVFGTATSTLAVMLPESPERIEKSKQELMAAGFYGPHAMMNLSAVRYLAIMVPLMIFGTFLVLAPPWAEMYAVIGLVLVPLLGWSLPRIYLQNKGSERIRQIEQAMPDMLDLLNMCVSQGLTVTESLTRIGQELRPVYPALSQELRIVGEQARLGTLEQALMNLNQRLDVPDVHSFTALLIQTERMGTSISQALSGYSDSMRTTLQQRADEKGNKAAFKLLFPTVLCLMPAVYLILLGPSIVAIHEFVNGDGPNSRQQIQQNLSNVRRVTN